MAATILDYKGSEPSSTVGATTVLPGGQTVPITVPAGGTPLVLADLGIFLSFGAPNRVVLLATIGLNSALVATPALVTITIFRDGAGIYTAQRTLVRENTEYDYTLQGVDFNVAGGFHTYTVSITTTVAGVLLNGPISFSGTAYQLM